MFTIDTRTLIWYNFININICGVNNMKAVVTVVGRDTVGILAKVASVCAGHNANILDVTQSVMKEIFTMVMIIDITDINGSFSDLQNALIGLGESIGMKIHVMHEDIFNSMHSI